MYVCVYNLPDLLEPNSITGGASASFINLARSYGQSSRFNNSGEITAKSLSKNIKKSENEDQIA